MFLGSVHGRFSCQFCHQGREDDTFTNMAQAHEGLIADPSSNGACDACHREEAQATANSLHTNLWGEKTAIEKRGRCTFEGSGVEANFATKCASCHTTCGQCHVSRPNSVGGGFPKIGSYYSHRFRKTPDMNEQCTACHGSRVGVDFKGELEGNQPDVHRSKGYRCELCHTKEEIHGDNQHAGEHYKSRYEVATMPRCEDCHSPLPSNSYHNIHLGAGATANNRVLQCQVCHSQPYKNCTNCHNLGTPGFDIDPSRAQFKIAKNANPYRPEYDYAVVRHVPIDPGTYADWGLDLPGYLDEPTWKYASPHNILRWTPQTTVDQNKGCYDNCHNTPDSPAGYFLRESDLYADDGVTKLPDHDANIGIVVEKFSSSRQ
jgi:thiosulfate/3-mercaptopyruvate sulfurtransferase